jgi:hypothetical protein
MMRAKNLNGNCGLLAAIFCPRIYIYTSLKTFSEKIPENKEKNSVM